MKKTRIIILIVFILTGTWSLNAQQLPLYSQYMFNTLEINPAYAGFKQSIQFTSIFRRQFNGMKNSPQTALLSGDMPIGETNLGVGLKIVDDRISVSKTFGAQASLSYKIQGDNSNLAFGLQVGALDYRADFSRLTVADQGDPAFQQDINMMTANVGTGIFFNTKKLYAGFSIPNLVRSHLKESSINTTEYDMKQLAHIYLNAGYLIDLNDNFTLKPSFLLRGVKGIPLNYDLNANVFFRDLVSGGVSYRSHSALVGLLDFRLVPTLRLGYAYDYNLGRLNNFAKGSHEIILRYHIPFEKDELMPSYLF